MKHEKRAKTIDPNLANAGDSPPGRWGQNLRATYLHHRCWKMQDTFMMFSGSQDSTKNGNGSSAHYPIVPHSDPLDTAQTTRRYGYRIDDWDGSDPARDERPSGNRTEDTDTSSGGGTYDLAPLIQSHTGYPAAMSYFAYPESTLTDAAAQYLYPNTFADGKTSIGGTAGPGIGTIAQGIDHPDGDGVITQTRRCLFGWSHPVCCYVIGNSATITWFELFNQNQNYLSWTTDMLKTRPRNLRERTLADLGTTRNTRVAITVQHDAGSIQVLFRTPRGTNTLFAYLPDTTVTSWTTYYYNGLQLDPDGEGFQVFFKVDNTQAVLVKSVAVWEHETGEEV
jgi:hypothetical protein